VIMTDQTTDWPRQLNYAYLSPPAPVLPLFKPEAQISTPKMDQDSSSIFLVWLYWKLNSFLPLLFCLISGVSDWT
jgi:hypothetical protein